ncbi:hypothetical protein [Agromyces larvae]|uniref:Alpha/beta hydrolase n=1 Tax=Agromyces larvae TaxID=2929802 RepID=A0ABY4BWR4_9MICO|nr:hypothetical protein [Agromyces larvae]UOE43344.1 hypothetical protein MTO99_14290 [Agromyces larvae]
MSDDLTITSGSASTVAVDDLLVEAAALGALAHAADEWRTQVRQIHGTLAALDLDAEPGAWGANAPVHDLAHAWYLLERAIDRAERLRAALVGAADTYGATEQRVRAMWDFGTRVGAWLIGGRLPMMLGPLGILGVGGVAGLLALGARVRSAVDPNGTSGDLRRLLGSAGFIRVVRAAGGALDELLLGAAGVPLPLAMTLGDRVRTPENTAVLMGLAKAASAIGNRALVETPVGVRPAATTAAGAAASTPVAPPAGLGELGRRLPSPQDGDPQIAVERYDTAEGPRFIVYVAGTVDTGVVPGSQPLDLTNDVAAVAESAELAQVLGLGEDASAMSRAVREALSRAGASSTDPVLAVGYSAGGIVAGDLLGDGAWNVERAVNLGGPNSQADLGGKPMLSVEHSDDLVPALGGPEQSGAERLVVTRQAVDGGEPVDGVLPGHDLARYRETLALLDASDAPEVVEFETYVREFTAGAPGVRTEWTAVRLDRAGAGGDIDDAAGRCVPVSPARGGRPDR